ncbi:hypothetical protein HID58_014383 [Brassica napus]|uniref:VPS37 C-terminal domain-containing protein n=1 Tax=Brassica napus TaxID=3708 RepID=A0ABQ8DJK7_BRANA|nr:hypothetical protein HID58_014383 [Brassica napus]
MFNVSFFGFNQRGSKEQQGQSRPPPEVSSSSQQQQQPWYSPSLVSSPSSSSRPQTSGQIPAHVSPGEAAGIITFLKDKSVDELRKLLSDKDAYQQFLLSLDQVKVQNNIKEELRRETLQLARENLEKEPQIMELRNQVSYQQPYFLFQFTMCNKISLLKNLVFLVLQCKIIRTTELAAAQEKLNELERQKEEILRLYSPGSLLNKLQEAMNEVDEESEALQEKFLEKEIDTAAFVQKYKKLRTIYHRRALIHLAAKTSTIG